MNIVRPTQLPAARVPDNSNSLNLIGRIGNQLGAIKKEREVESMRQRKLELADQLMNGTPEQKQAAQIDLGEQQQVEQIQAQAQEDRDIQRSNSNKARMLNDPVSKKALLELHSYDPQMAALTMDIMSAEDNQAKMALANEAKDAVVTYTNALTIGSSDEMGGIDASKQFIAEKIAQMGDDDSGRLQELMTLEGDQYLQGLQRHQALAGSILSVPDVQQAFKNSITERETAVKERQVSVQEANITDRSTQERNTDLREQQLDLERQKFQRSGGKLSAGAEKALMQAQDEAQQSRASSGELLTLAQEYESISNSGATAKWRESLKEFAGTEDAVTSLRKRYNALKNSQVMKSLPPGVASDKDIEIAMSGFLDNTANPKEVAAFLKGMSKIESLNAEYKEFKSNWLSDNGNTRGMLKQWNEQSSDIAISEDTNQEVDDNSENDDAALLSKYGIN